MRMLRPLCTCILLLSFVSIMAPATAAALEVSASEWELGMRWIGNEEELENEDGGEDSGGTSSTNMLTGSFSFRLPLAFSEDSSLSFVPGISLYTLWYREDDKTEEDEKTGRTILSDMESKGRITALVPLLDAGLRWDFYSRGSASTHLAMEGGLGFESPIPLRASDDADASKIIGSGYYGRGKFFLPFISFMGYWPLTDAYDISSRLNVHLPVHHIWDGEKASFYDHLMVSISVGLRFPTEERSVIEPPEPPTPEGAPPLPE
ncbi:MAG: hypothetical protein ACLFNZ_07695 [Spirochaetaceae bacterium]